MRLQNALQNNKSSTCRLGCGLQILFHCFSSTKLGSATTSIPGEFKNQTLNAFPIEKKQPKTLRDRPQDMNEADL